MTDPILVIAAGLFLGFISILVYQSYRKLTPTENLKEALLRKRRNRRVEQVDPFNVSGLPEAVSLMDETSNKWMVYIDTEVRAACKKKGWGSQIRRKWSVRDKPVALSNVDDYEWKLLPDAEGALPEQQPTDFDEGIYYVLSIDRRAKNIVLQHDTNHAGANLVLAGKPGVGGEVITYFAPDFWQKSFTEFQLAGLGDHEYRKLLQEVGDLESNERVPAPPQNGQLRDLLVNLTSRFKPNHFSIT